MATCGDDDVEVAAAAGECYNASLEMWNCGCGGVLGRRKHGGIKYNGRC
jgi:hypothetical protein